MPWDLHALQEPGWLTAARVLCWPCNSRMQMQLTIVNFCMHKSFSFQERHCRTVYERAVVWSNQEG